MLENVAQRLGCDLPWTSRHPGQDWEELRILYSYGSSEMPNSTFEAAISPLSMKCSFSSSFHKRDVCTTCAHTVCACPRIDGPREHSGEPAGPG